MKPEFLKLLPSLEELKKDFKLLENKIAFENLNDFNSIRDYLPPSVKIYPTILLTDSIFETTEFIRLCYPFNEKEKFNPSSIYPILRFANPTKEYCKKFGRLNLPDNPVFYASIDDFSGAAKEYRLNHQMKGEFFLGIWNLKKGEIILTEFFPMAASKNQDVKNFLEPILSNLTLSMNSEDEAKMKALNEFHLKEFTLQNPTNDQNVYKITSYFGYDILYNWKSKEPSIRTDAIVYPSCIKNNLSSNIAIHPDTVLNKMELTEIYRLKFLNSQKLLRFKPLEKGKIANGMVTWEKPNNTDRFRLKQLIEKT